MNFPEIAPAVMAVICPSHLLLQEKIQALRLHVLTEKAEKHTLEKEQMQNMLCLSSHIYYGDNSQVEDIIDTAQSPHWFSKEGRRFLWLKNLHLLNTTALQKLMTYMEKPSPQSVLCMTAPKSDQRLKFYQWLHKQHSLYNLDVPKPQALGPWLCQKAKDNHDVLLSPQASQMLIEYIGHDIDLLLQSLEQIALYALHEPRIEVQHVNAVLTRSQHHSLFAWIKTALSKQWAKATLEAHQLLHEGESLLLLLNLLGKQLKFLLYMKDNDTASPQLLAQKFSIQPFVLNNLRPHLAHFHAKQLQKGLMIIAHIEQNFKQGKINNYLAIELLLASLYEKPEQDILSQTAMKHFQPRPSNALFS